MDAKFKYMNESNEFRHAFPTQVTNLFYLLGCSEDMSGVGSNSVDWTVMGFEFGHLSTCINMPQLQISTSTSTQQTVTPRQER